MSSLDVFARMAEEDKARAGWYESTRRRFGLLYGVLAGVAFALVAWGWDAIGLAGAHGFLPWAKLALGVVPSVALTMLVAWVATRIDRRPVSLLLWVLAGVALALLATRVALQGSAALFGLADPQLRELINYPFTEGIRARQGVAIVLLGALGLLAGLFADLFVEGSTTAIDPIGRWGPVLVWSVIFVVAGSVADGLINSPFRAPVVVIDDLVQFALDIEGTDVDRAVRIERHVGALNAVEELLHRPRRLLLGDYDSTLSLANVLIDFDGTWATCSVIVGQPSYCRPLES
ncbi:MAG TPA: hypothetical protein VER55_11620 [Ardenticatenaceae bacterium]|nr:hypothetical protein [Ardenticatenaceae bacterium]